jgi:hypothetical protein
MFAACVGDSSEEAGSSSEEDESSGDDDDVMPPRGLHNLLQPELLTLGPSGASEWGELQLADDDTAAGKGDLSSVICYKLLLLLL